MTARPDLAPVYDVAERGMRDDLRHWTAPVPDVLTQAGEQPSPAPGPPERPAACTCWLRPGDDPWCPAWCAAEARPEPTATPSA